MTCRIESNSKCINTDWGKFLLTVRLSCGFDTLVFTLITSLFVFYSFIQNPKNGNGRTVVCQNTTIHRNIKIPIVKETLHNTYLRHHSLTYHPNFLMRQISQNMLPDWQHRRLERKRTTDILRENAPQIY